MARLVVRPAAQPLHGSAVLPSDKSICHRSLIFAALSRGTCHIQGFSFGADNVATLHALRQMGVECREDAQGRVQVQGVGLWGLRAPDAAIDESLAACRRRWLSGRRHTVREPCHGTRLRLARRQRALTFLRSPA